MTKDILLTSGRRPTLTAKAQIRATSDCLKWVGFRPGAPIYRATPEFTLADLKQALFPVERRGTEPELRFTITVSHEEIWMYVAAIRKFDLTGNEKVAWDLFPRAGLEWQYWMVEGLLLRPDPDPEPDAPSMYRFVYSEAYADDHDVERQYPNQVPMIPDDLFLEVIAMIAADEQGRLMGAVVQRPPSPADQILVVPPL